MDFSVLMSVYEKDNPDYYKLALESVTTYQTLKPNQIVIVYDGPVPLEIESNTIEVKQMNPDVEFTIIKQDKNQGLATALNVGLRECANEYVARMDADDYAVPDRFQKQISFLSKHSNIDVLGGTIAEFAENPQKIISIRTVGHTHEEILKMAKRRNPFNHMTVIYKKSKVLAVGGYNVDFGKLEDYKLWVDLIANGAETLNLEDVLIHMRIGNGMLSRRSNKREIQDWDKLQKDLINAGIINQFESILNKIYIRVFVYMPVGLKKNIYKMALRKKIN